MVRVSLFIVLLIWATEVRAEHDVDLLDDFTLTVPGSCSVRESNERPIECTSDDGNTVLTIFYDGVSSRGPGYTQRHLQQIAANPSRRQALIASISRDLLKMAKQSDMDDFALGEIDIRRVGDLWAIVASVRGTNKNGVRVHTSKVQIWVEKQACVLTALFVDPNTDAYYEILNTLKRQVEPAPPVESEQSAQNVSGYSVGGFSLGDRVSLKSASYKSYTCTPSEQYSGFTWCQRIDRTGRGRKAITSSLSLLHHSDGTISYVNRAVRPASLTNNEVGKEIDRLSKKFGDKPRVLNAPKRTGLPQAVIAMWGDVELLDLDSASIEVLAAGQSPRTGLLIDFLGDLHKSARKGLPVHKLGGGPGYIWSASFDDKGIGHLRFLAVDMSAMSEAPTSAQSSFVSGLDHQFDAEKTAKPIDQHGLSFLRSDSVPTNTLQGDTDVFARWSENAETPKQPSKQPSLPERRAFQAVCSFERVGITFINGPCSLTISEKTLEVIAGRNRIEIAFDEEVTTAGIARWNDGQNSTLNVELGTVKATGPATSATCWVRSDARICYQQLQADRGEPAVDVDLTDILQ